MKDRFDYYYGNEAEQFTFYRIPKVLFTSERFSGLSCESKVLYGLMLDRMGLSMKNHWLDEQNRVYIYFKLEDVMKYIHCGRDKGVKLLAELDSVKGVGLIERRRQGMGKPDIIYVKNYIGEESNFSQPSETQTSPLQENVTPNFEKQPLIVAGEGLESEKETSEKPNSVNLKNRCQDYVSSEGKSSEKSNTEFLKNRTLVYGKPEPNDIDINNTKFNNTNLSNHPLLQDHQKDGLSIIEMYRRLIKQNIEYITLCNDYGKEKIDGIVDLILDIVCSSESMVRIHGQYYPSELVKSRFLKLNSFHIQYVLDCMEKNTKKVHNIRNYLITALYNAPSTMEHYYRAEVNHDLYG